jgi:PPIC-type PPIASE domain
MTSRAQTSLSLRRDEVRLLSAGAARAGIALAIAAALVLGCGEGSAGRTVASVGGAIIGDATVDHWARAISLGNAVGISLARSSGPPRQRALDFLISTDWLLGAAAEHGVEVSDEAVKRGFRERVSSLPNGQKEFEEELSSTKQTDADVVLEIKATLAATALRSYMSRNVAAVSPAEIATYYGHNLARFRVPDKREVDLIESLASPASAIALGKRLGTGRHFEKRAIRELVARQTPYEAGHRENRALVQAIFDATPGKLSGPVQFNRLWVILVVRKVKPGHQKPLPTVGGEIARLLLARRKREALASFAADFRRRWTAKTNCKPGYVVPKCSEYRGPRISEENPLQAAG